MAHQFQDAPAPPTALGRLRILSPTSGLRVSSLCLGAMSAGQAWTDLLGTMDKEASFKLFDAFVAAGGNFVDTASNYQDEESETWLGEWMAARGIRDQLVVATKYSCNFRSYAVGKGTQAANFWGNHRKSLHVSVRESLKKLQTDYIDILYMHFWDYTTSIKEVMDGLHALVEQGKVLYLGVSDTPAWVVAAANQYALDSGKTPFCVYQGRWSVLDRDLERDIIPMARRFGMAIAPWNVLHGGGLRSAAEIEAARGSGGLRPMHGPEQSPDERAVSAVMDDIAAELGGGATVPGVAIAYVRAKYADVVPIVGGRRVAHLEGNIRALELTLSPEQVARIEAVVPFALGFPYDIIEQDPAVTGKPTGWLARSAHTEFPTSRKLRDT